MFKKLAGLIAVVTAGLLWVGMASAGSIVSSAHDFSAEAWNTAPGEGQICQVCHTPHDSIGTDAPLWNRAAAAVGSGVTYIMYNSGATSGTVDGAIDATPTGTSLLCLSCHDGVGALDAFGANAGLVGGSVIASGFQVDPNMTNDHPISITYTETSAGGSALNDTEMQALTNEFAWGNTALGTGTVANLLEAGGDGIPRVQCNSCHDVHNTQSAGGANSYLLRVDNGGSDLCLACHAK